VCGSPTFCFFLVWGWGTGKGTAEQLIDKVTFREARGVAAYVSMDKEVVRFLRDVGLQAAA